MRILYVLALLACTSSAVASQRVPSQLTLSYGSESGVTTELRAVRGKFYGVLAAVDSGRGWSLNSGVYTQRTRNFDIGAESLAIYILDGDRSILGASAFQEGYAPYTYGIVKSKSLIGLMYEAGRGASFYWKYEVTPQIRNLGVPLSIGRSPITRAFETSIGIRYMW